MAVSEFDPAGQRLGNPPPNKGFATTMSHSTRRRRLVKVAAAAAALGSLAAIGFVGNSPAQAEPKQFSGINTFGSDTLQEVTNAFAGFADGKTYTPLVAGATNRVITNWDTLPDNQCMSTKSGSPSFHRPNGSSEGRYMLGIAAGGGTYQSTFCGSANVGGVIDVARTSSFVTTNTGPLVYVPLGRDATGFAYFAKSGVTPVTSLTRAQLQTIYTAGVLAVGGTRIIPCGIQLGSGTFNAWNSAVLITAAQEAVAQAECNAIVTATDDNDGRLQESKPIPLRDKGNGAAANTQVIVGFSAANFIAQQNDVAPSVGGNPLSLGVDLGTVTNGSTLLGQPYTTAAAIPPATGTVYSASGTYYNDGSFGRTIGYVLPAATVDEPGELEIKAMFTNLNGTAKICSAPAQATTGTFGFLIFPAVAPIHTFP